MNLDDAIKKHLMNLPSEELIEIYRIDESDLKITEEQFQGLCEFEHWANEMGIAWIHWSTIEMDTYLFKNLHFFISHGFLVRHSDLPPKYDDWRDRFPPRKYSMTPQAVVVLRSPGKYVIKDDD